MRKEGRQIVLAYLASLRDDHFAISEGGRRGAVP